MKNLDWTHLSRSWPDVIYLNRVDQLQNFPWKQNTFRKFTSKNGDPKLKTAKFYLANFVCILKKDLVDFMQAEERWNL